MAKASFSFLPRAIKVAQSTTRRVILDMFGSRVISFLLNGAAGEISKDIQTELPTSGEVYGGREALK
jgi:hypothetical protein